MTDPKDRPKPPVVKTREPGKKPGVFDNIRQPTALPQAERHPIEEILGFGSATPSDPTPVVRALAPLASADRTPAVSARVIAARQSRTPSDIAQADSTPVDSTAVRPTPVEQAGVESTPTRQPDQPRPIERRRERTRSDTARADSTGVLPALAYDLENLTNLRRYVAREHWVDDEVFVRFRLSPAEQTMMRQIWRLTLGWGRLAATCSMERMAERCVMSLSAAKQTRKSIVGRGLVATEGRSDGPRDTRGQVWRLLEPAIPPAEFAGILEACEAAKARAEAETARVRSTRVDQTSAGSGRMKGHESQVINWSVDRLQTIAVQMVDEARVDGEGKPTVEEIEREIRKVLRRSTAQAGVDFLDSDVIAVAAKWGRE